MAAIFKGKTFIPIAATKRVGLIQALEPMELPQLLAVLFLALVALLWSMVIWGGWAEKYVAAGKASRSSWFWLRVFSVPQTPYNRIRFVKGISAIGIVFAALGIIGVLLTSHVAGL